MDVCVVGAGAIGGLIAARVGAAGHHVSVLARGDHLTALRERGLSLLELDGATTVAHVDASADLGDFGPQEVVILALKAHQIAEVAPSLPPLYRDETIVVPLQNGIPWWFFQKFGGPHDGHRLRTPDRDGSIGANVPPDRLIGCI